LHYPKIRASLLERLPYNILKIKVEIILEVLLKDLQIVSKSLKVDYYIFMN